MSEKNYIKKISKDDPMFMGMDTDSNMVAVRIDSPMGEKIDKPVKCVIGAYTTDENKSVSTAFACGMAGEEDYCAMLLSMCSTLFDNVFSPKMMKLFLDNVAELALDSIVNKLSQSGGDIGKLLKKLMENEEDQ